MPQLSAGPLGAARQQILTGNQMFDILRKDIQFIRQHLRVYLFVNLMLYGLIILFAVVAAKNPELSSSFRYSISKSFQSGWFAPTYQAYFVQRSFLLAFTFTFIFNLFVASGLMLTLPSFIIPFSGILFSIRIFILIGLLTGPTKLNYALIGTALLEGQGYILATFAIWYQSTWMLLPRRYGFSSFKQAFLAGLRLTRNQYVLIALVLLVSAAFESLTVIAATRPIFPRQSNGFILFQEGDSTYHISNSCVYYNSRKASLSDAKIVGVLLGDIRYFSYGDTACARISVEGERFDIQLLLPSSLWDKHDIQSRFTTLCSTLKHNFPNRQQQVTAISIDSSGRQTKRIFN